MIDLTQLTDADRHTLITTTVTALVSLMIVRLNRNNPTRALVLTTFAVLAINLGSWYQNIYKARKETDHG